MITRLKLVDFKVFQNQEIPLCLGTTSIVGPNGSGKSTILEAIEFGLFRTVTRKQKRIPKLEDLIRHGMNKATVELGFMAPRNGREYTVVRNIFQGRTTADLYQTGIDDPVESGVTRVDKEVVALIGADRDAFSALTYVRQGEIDLLSRLSPKEKREHLHDMMGLGVYNTSVERVSRRLTEYSSQLRQVESSIESLTALKEHLPSENSVAEALASIQSLRTRHGDSRDLQTLSQLVERISLSLESIGREIAAHRDSETIREFENSSNVAKQLRTVLEAIPGVAENQLRPKIREEARSIFLGIFGDRYSDLLIDDDFEISLFDTQGNRVPLMAASGGEDVCVNFSLRVAVNSALQKYSVSGPGPSLLVLDEPGAGLDSQRRRWLPSAIDSLEGIEQVLVITHMEELREAADRIITLTPQGKGRQPTVEVMG